MLSLGSVADWVAAAAGLISAGGVIWTLRYAVVSAREARHDMVEPILTVEFDLPRFENGQFEVLMTVSNFGTGPALAPRVRVIPDAGEGSLAPEPQDVAWPFIPHFSPDYPVQYAPPNVKSVSIHHDGLVRLQDPWRKTEILSFTAMPPGGHLILEYRGRLGKRYRKTASYTITDGRPVCNWPE